MRQTRVYALRLAALLLAALLLIGAMPTLPARAEGESEPLPYWIGVDVRNQRVTIYGTANNSVVHRWRCSTGTSSTPTPTGTFTLPASPNNNRREWYHFGSVYVKWAVRVTGGIYFHSVLFSRANDSTLLASSVRKLGHPASHGCIRLEVPNAKWISDNIAIGTRVIIHKGVDDRRITNVLGGNAGVNVTPSMPALPTVQALTLSQAGPLTLGKGESVQLSCAVVPESVATKLTWRSSRPKCVTVDQNGLVTAVGNGTATVSVTASNGVKASLKVTSVDPTIAVRVAINADKTVYVNVGETLQLGANVEPVTATSALTWKSSKPLTAAVDGNGLVTGVRKGSAKITVTTANKKKASVTVKVVNPYEPRSVRIGQTGPVTLHVGETLQLTSVLTPDNARTVLSWTSSRKKIATVDGNGLVTATRKGTAKITVKTDNRKKATILIKVVD